MSNVKFTKENATQALPLQALRDHVDFLSSQNRYRCHHASYKNELLARAIGIKAGKRPRIIDTTAGFGRDALLLATLGCEVIMLERCDNVAALLRQALAKAKTDPDFAAVIARMTLIETDSIAFLKEATHRAHYPAEVIYLDPMFPPRKKSAQVKKAMQILQALLASEPSDAAHLLQAAIDYQPKRIVIKRPVSAQIIAASMPPTFTMKGSSCRFDIYFP